MPNYCDYSMCVKGKKDNIEEFIKVIEADYDYNTMQFSFDRHFFRVFEADYDEIEKVGRGVYQVIINGYCAWSVASCMFEDGYYRNVRKEHRNTVNFKGTTIPLESKRLQLDIEIYSSE